MKVLIVKSNINSFERKINKWFLEENNIDVLNFEAENTGISKRLAILSTLKSFRSKHRNNYDKVIVFDDTVFYIYSRLFFSNCYLWFWNTVPSRKGEFLRLKVCKMIHSKIYTFDKADCKRFEINYNTQFFNKEISYSKSATCPLYFVGKDKGRFEIINTVYTYLVRNSLNPLFQMMPDSNNDYKNRNIICNRFVEYDEVLKHVQESKAVLDISKPGQIGMTYRAMEALFYDKKIVTNNTHYREFPFYSPESIYFLEDGLEGLKDFIEAPEVKYDETIKDYYSIQNWLRRFE